ncbi:twin-arginine translocation signal domain-containing protein, partial [Bacillus atrophaeus ATCC 9372]
MAVDKRMRIGASGLSRRRFVQGVAAGGVLAALPALGQAGKLTTLTAQTGQAPVLTGSEIDLVVAESWVNFTGQLRLATTINGSIPAPTLRLLQGDTVTLRVTNKLAEATAIHWHGIILPYQMDGVPGISFAGIATGETFTYRFQLAQSGTYWYHSHSGMQELTGMYGALIIEPSEGEMVRSDRDYEVLLSDWTDEDPMRVFSRLKTQGDYYNYNQPTVVDFFRDVSTESMRAALSKRQMWNAMRMSPTDLADLS